MIVIWGKNFSNLIKQFMASSLLFTYGVVSDFHYVKTAKNVCNRNFIVIPLSLNELSTNLVQQVKIKRLFISVVRKKTFLNYLLKAR